jgi:uncharacterized protein (TIGR02328 family)
MRIWHWKLLPYLPKSQLLAQWRELNSIFKKQDKHILINYVYNYPKSNLYNYALMVMVEMEQRNYKIKKLDNYWDFFEDTIGVAKIDTDVFLKHHTKQYLLQCFMNLEEKYFCGQKDFNRTAYLKLWNFVNNELNGLLQEISKELKEEN